MMRVSQDLLMDDDAARRSSPLPSSFVLAKAGQKSCECLGVCNFFHRRSDTLQGPRLHDRLYVMPTLHAAGYISLSSSIGHIAD